MKIVISLFVFFLCVNFNLLAQDIIVTKDATLIEAIITEVSPTEIRYKKTSNPHGPTFIIYESEVSAIIYKNGERQTFEKTQKEKNEAGVSVPIATELKSETVKVNDSVVVAQTKEVQAQQIITLASDAVNITDLPKFTKKKVPVEGKRKPKTRYCGGNMVFKEKEFMKFIKERCPEAYSHYTKSDTYAAVAYIFLPTLILAPVSLVFSTIALSQLEKILGTYNTSCATK